MSERLDKFIEDCTSNRILDIYHFFTKEQIEIIEKLGKKLENKKYTIYEFDVLENEILEFFKSKQDLEKRNISKEEYSDILKVFSKISEEYNI